MPRKDISTAIQALGDDMYARPVLDLAVWPSIADQFQLGHLPFPVPMSFDNSTTQNFAQFEERTFQVIGFVCEILSSPFQELSDFKFEFGRKNDMFCQAWGGAHKAGCCRFAMEGTKNHYQPFEGIASHAEAAAGALSDEFLKAMQSLEVHAYRSVLMWTGGSAPFDYVKVHLTDVAKRKITIALGDAKHKSAPAKHKSQTTNQSTNEKDVVEEAKNLGAKALPWFKGMKRELEKQGYVVDTNFSVSLITNIEMPEYKRAAVKCDNGVQVVILSPSSFTFKPWTDLLFRCIPKTER
jgi:hypothetical protein